MHQSQQKSSACVILRSPLVIHYRPRADFTHAWIQRGGQGGRTPPPLKNYNNVGFLATRSGSPEKSQSYQASIQCRTRL